MPGGAQFTQRTFCSDYRTADGLLYQNVVPGTWWTGVASPPGKSKVNEAIAIRKHIKGRAGQMYCFTMLCLMRQIVLCFDD